MDKNRQQKKRRIKSNTARNGTQKQQKKEEEEEDKREKQQLFDANVHIQYTKLIKVKRKWAIGMHIKKFIF